MGSLAAVPRLTGRRARRIRCLRLGAGGADALDELKKNSYSFLLTDIRLPQINGIEVIRRAKIEIPDLSIVAMTGYSKEYSYVDVINAGATDFINKPFGIGEIEAKVRRAIIERNIKDELSRLSITDSLTTCVQKDIQVPKCIRKRTFRNKL